MSGLATYHVLPNGTCRVGAYTIVSYVMEFLAYAILTGVMIVFLRIAEKCVPLIRQNFRKPAQILTQNLSSVKPVRIYTKTGDKGSSALFNGEKQKYQFIQVPVL